MRRLWQITLLAVFTLIRSSTFLVLATQKADPEIAELRVAHEEEAMRGSPAAADCTYLKDPEEFLSRASRHRREVSTATEKVGDYLRPLLLTRQDLDSPIPRNNFIDDYIFGRMEAAAIRPAPLASDAEFLRRVTLDLSGRIPSAREVEAFLNDSNPNKRNNLIDALLTTPEFTDKWTMFLGDLYRNNGPATNVNRYFQGRDAFYSYLKEAISLNKPYNQIATELLSATGDSFVEGATNFVVGGTIPMGPIQDTYDGQAVNVASMFLGIHAVDCLLCHDGARRLDGVNLWGEKETRWNMWGLSAFFARTRMQREVVSREPLVAKFRVSDVQTGDYVLNTRIGNRSPREPQNGTNRITPQYPFNGRRAEPGETHRQALARLITNDIQFSRATVNYIWEKFMVEAFVSPSNGFDIARLDPENPPPAPWTLQPTNPELLNAMAQWFRENNYDLRQLMALITKSSTYQLSSVYPDTWKVDYVPYYARKYVRRLDAEEIHDAIAKATGILGNYSLEVRGADYSLPNVQWAMQFPDTREPRSNGQVSQFLNSFGRGDRDQTQRRWDGSVLQSLNLMNHPFVMARIHVNNQGSTVSRLVNETDDTLQIVRQVFLFTLSRSPTQSELDAIWPMMLQLGNQLGAESLQWALLNKLDFIFNY